MLTGSSRLVLDEGGERPPTGRVVQLVGGRLIAQVSQNLKPNTCVRIDCEDALLLGEVLGWWREGVASFVAVKLMQMLTGPNGMALGISKCLLLEAPQKCLGQQLQLVRYRHQAGLSAR
jgi:hypothetical protein